MHDILEKIIGTKKDEIALLRGSSLRQRTRSDAKRPFARVLCQKEGPSLIAEVKKASPSKGIIREDFDHRAIAIAYETAGAHALSVLTDQVYFKGHLSYLTDIRTIVSVPLLRKDFIIDPLQIEEAASVNADAILLIAAALSQSQLGELYAAALDLDLDVLTEVHDRAELDRVLDLGISLIGINNRNLRTFQTDIQTTLSLMECIPASVAVISESGIENGAIASRLFKAGVHGFLVGESLMRINNPTALVKELINAHQN